MGTSAAYFGFPPGAAERYELYNLRADLGEADDRASAEPARVAELDRLIDGFLAETGALYPRPNPAYQPTDATPAPDARARPRGRASCTDLLRC